MQSLQSVNSPSSRQLSLAKHCFASDRHRSREQTMEPADFEPALLSTLGFPAEPEIDRIVDGFFARLPAELAAIHAALTTAEAHQVETLSHRLKGAAASLGFERLENLIASPDPANPGHWKAAVEQRAAEALQAYTLARSERPGPNG